MKTSIVLLTLTLTSGGASADGFRPWANNIDIEAVSRTEAERVPFSGFAPWRDRVISISDVNDKFDVAHSYDIGFRPWS